MGKDDTHKVDLRTAKGKEVDPDENVVKVNLADFKKKEDDKETTTPVAKVAAEDSTDTNDTVGDSGSDDTTDTESTGTEDAPVIEEVLEEVKDNDKDGKPEKKTTEDIKAEIKEEVKDKPELELPENIQKLVEFMKETNGTVEDYVKLNRDFSKASEDELLKEYYKSTKGNLSDDEIQFYIEDEFEIDEDIDDERDIKRKNIRKKEAIREAKKFLEGQKEKYYAEIKAGSNLPPEQQKAVDFFNRYNKEQEERSTVVQRQSEVFKQKTDQVFSQDFKGFEFSVGDKKYRYNVKNADQVKNSQSDINNFVKKFLGEDGTMKDAKSYHKSLFAAMNPDALAKHFYEQGKADMLKESQTKAKNINMDPRAVHQGQVNVDGFKVRVVNDNDNASRLRVKNVKFN